MSVRQHAFLTRRAATCIATQSSKNVAVADVKLDGRLTLSENVADNGGLRLDSGDGHGSPATMANEPMCRVW